MLVRRLLRLLLEPARDPLHDSLDISVGRVAALRGRLEKQISELRLRAARIHDSALDDQIRHLDAEHGRLRQLEERLAAELDAARARRDLLSARQTAAQAQVRLDQLLEALDAAHARAAALAQLSVTIAEDALCPPPR